MSEANPFDPQETVEPAGGAGVDLSAFDDEYAQAEAPSFEEVPDGKYQVKVATVKLGETQKDDPILKFDLEVISGAHEGRHIFKNSVITTASLPFVKGDLQKMGIELGKFSELPGHLEEMLDKKIEVTKRTKGAFSNVYFDRLLAVPGDAFDGEKPPWG